MGRLGCEGPLYFFAFLLHPLPPHREKGFLPPGDGIIPSEDTGLEDTCRLWRPGPPEAFVHPQPLLVGLTEGCPCAQLAPSASAPFLGVG